MSDPRITDEAVEAAARALFVAQDGDFIQSDKAWLSTFEVSRRPKYTRFARAALEAALPHLEIAPQPVVDREQIKAAMCRLDGPVSTKSADVRAVVVEALYGRYADAVLALINRGAE
jgi:hypothetical protein